MRPNKTSSMAIWVVSIAKSGIEVNCTMIGCHRLLQLALTLMRPPEIVVRFRHFRLEFDRASEVQYRLAKFTLLPIRPPEIHERFGCKI